MTEFNRGQIGEALARFTGLKGLFKPDLQQQLVPTINVDDLRDSPYYVSFGVPVMARNAGGPTAARYSGVVAVPGPAHALVIHQVMIVNTTAAAVIVRLAHIDAAEIASMANVNTRQFFDLSSSQQGRERPSFCRYGTFASLPGGSVGLGAVQAGNSLIVPLPSRPIMFGNDEEGGASGFAVVMESGANVAIEAVTFFAREWPLPG